MRPKKVILCVDDNEQDLSVLKFMLVTNGYRVVAATNGQEAIALFAENQVDLVLADHAMPHMNTNTGAVSASTLRSGDNASSSSRSRTG